MAGMGKNKAPRAQGDKGAQEWFLAKQKRQAKKRKLQKLSRKKNRQ